VPFTTSPFTLGNESYWDKNSTSWEEDQNFWYSPLYQFHWCGLSEGEKQEVCHASVTDFPSSKAEKQLNLCWFSQRFNCFSKSSAKEQTLPLLQKGQTPKIPFARWQVLTWS